MIDLLLLQLADSAFPAGGFAHSAGLEAATQLGEATGDDGLGAFIDGVVWQAGLAAGPFVQAAHAAGSIEALVALDAACDAFLVQHVSNRASRTQGRTLASTAASVWDHPDIQRFAGAVHARSLRGHHAVVYGAVTRALDVGAAESLRLFVYLACRGVISAAVRLGRVGPLEAQRMLVARRPLVDRVTRASEGLTVDDAAQPAPIADLVGGVHDRLYARLFQS